jgi:hypothetical protein
MPASAGWHKTACGLCYVNCGRHLWPGSSCSRGTHILRLQDEHPVQVPHRV